MGPFRDVIASLAAQTDTDFEWLVIGHRLSAEERRAVEHHEAAVRGFGLS